VLFGSTRIVFATVQFIQRFLDIPGMNMVVASTRPALKLLSDISVDWNKARRVEGENNDKINIRRRENTPLAKHTGRRFGRNTSGEGGHLDIY